MLCSFFHRCLVRLLTLRSSIQVFFFVKPLAKMELRLIIRAVCLVSLLCGEIASKPTNKYKGKVNAAIKELEDETWAYDNSAVLNPHNWFKKYPACAGKRQSPIAFYRDNVRVNPNLNELIFHNYNKALKPGELRVVNNGHTFEIDVTDAKLSRIWIASGGLPTWYQLVQFHFHWSHDDKIGSEHVVGDTSEYPLVIHFVHTKEGMELHDALKVPDGLAVLAVTFELVHYRDQANTELTKITEHLDDVKFRGQYAEIKESLILEKLLPEDRSNFFRYEGSLTTPPCSESVIWTVFVNTANATKVHLNSFRRLFNSKKNENRIGFIDKNYRGVMPLNGRTVEIRKKIFLPYRIPIYRSRPNPSFLRIGTNSLA